MARARVGLDVWALRLGASVTLLARSGAALPPAERSAADLLLLARAYEVAAEYGALDAVELLPDSAPGSEPPGPVIEPALPIGDPRAPVTEPELPIDTPRLPSIDPRPMTDLRAPLRSQRALANDRITPITDVRVRPPIKVRPPRPSVVVLPRLSQLEQPFELSTEPQCDAMAVALDGANAAAASVIDVAQAGLELGIELGRALVAQGAFRIEHDAELQRAEPLAARRSELLSDAAVHSERIASLERDLAAIEAAPELVAARVADSDGRVALPARLEAARVFPRSLALDDPANDPALAELAGRWLAASAEAESASLPDVLEQATEHVYDATLPLLSAAQLAPTSSSDALSAWADAVQTLLDALADRVSALGTLADAERAAQPLHTELEQERRAARLLSDQVLALSADPADAAALVAFDRYQPLLERVALARAALDAHAAVDLDAALFAANAAKETFNDLARVDVAIGEAPMPVWSDAAISLIVNGCTTHDLCFVPGSVENLSWQVDAGINSEFPPFTFTLYERAGSLLLPLPPVALPSDRPIPGSTSIEILPERQVTERHTVVAVDSQGQPRERVTAQLIVQTPVARVRLGMGTYCGQVREVEARERVLDADDVVVKAVAPQYRYEPRAEGGFVTRAFGHYETPVSGKAMRAECRIQSTDYLRGLQSSPGDTRFDPSRFLALDDVARWDLSQFGMHCDFPVDDAQPESLRRAALEISQLALLESIATFSSFSVEQLRPAEPLRATPVAEPVLGAFERLQPDRQLWSAQHLQLCGAPICDLELPAADLFDVRCSEDACEQTTIDTRFSVIRSGVYWEPKSLDSSVRFMPQTP